MLFAEKAPAASRTTIAFTLLRELGGTFQANVNEPVVVTGEPVTVNSVGAFRATLVTVPLPPLPLPGKVCPGAKVMRPLLLIESPVSLGLATPVPNNKFNVAEGVFVLLPTGSA